MEYVSRGNSEEIEDNNSNEEKDKEETTEEMYILDNEENKENDDALFEVRENAFTRNEKDYSDLEINFTEENNQFIDLRSSIKLSNSINDNSNGDEKYIDNNFWVTKISQENLDFLNDL